MTRWKASAIHFAISLGVVSLIAAIVAWRWYPPELFGMAKAGQLMSILGGVDVVLGPLLTLVIYKQGKKSLKSDLTVIALLQLAAMVFGLSVIWQSRPVFMVAAEDRFKMIFANEISRENLEKASPEYKTLPVWGAVTVSAPLPSDPKRRERVIQLALNGLDITLHPEYFEPYPPADPAFLAHAATAEQAFRASSKADRSAWEEVFQRNATGSQSIAVLPLWSSRGSATVLVDPTTGAVIGFSSMDPWPLFNALRTMEAQSHSSRTMSSPSQ